MAYGVVYDLELGRYLHGCIIKIDLERDPDLLISLRAFYAKCGQVMVARSFFDKMKKPMVIMWNAKCGNVESARMVFDRTSDKELITWSSMIIGYGFCLVKGGRPLISTMQ